MHRLDTVVDSLKEQMVTTLREWIRIPSVKAQAGEGAPFGTELRRMLERALADCQALGFSTECFDGYAGHADMGEGSARDALGILVHLDVVPAGDGWTRDPFGATVEGDRLYGRGASDDKGPAVAALYAMHAVKTAGIPLKRKVRLILGCDEESGWEDMEYYRGRTTLPRQGFSPDASYPVINIEKGLCHLRLDARLPGGGLEIVSLNAGKRPNVIPGMASALLAGDQAVLAKKVAEISASRGWPVTLSAQGDHLRIETQGIPGHAAIPETARNAIGQLLIVLRDLGATGPLALLADVIGTDFSGRDLGVAVEDSLSGKLTLNMGILQIEADRLMATLDIRYPLMVDAERLIALVKNRLSGFDVSVTTLKPPHHVPQDSKLVTALLDSYHAVTGLERKALAIGGGTYARALEEGVAFGASFPGEAEVAHQADEYISVDSLMKSARIFARAIVNLASEG